MRVLIIEPYTSGHHLRYLRHIVSAALRRGWSVGHATTTHALTQPAYEDFRRDLSGQVQTLVIRDSLEEASGGPLSSDHFRHWLSYRHLFERICRQDKPDVIYLLNLDYSYIALSALGSPFGVTPFAGMLMNVSFHHRAMGLTTPWSICRSLKEAVIKQLLALPGMRSLMTLDELLAPYAESRRIRGREKICYVPELPVLDNNGSTRPTRMEIGIRDDQCVVLAYGSLGLRKGIGELLSAIAHPSCPTSVAVLLVGVQDEDVKALLTSDLAKRLSQGNRLFSIPSFVDPNVESAVFRAADIVWLGYRKFYGMSGVLLQAAMAGLPIVACQDGLIGWYARTYRLGEVVNLTALEDVVNALRTLALDHNLARIFAANCQTYATRYSAERFETAICDGLSTRRDRGDSRETNNHRDRCDIGA